MLFSKVAQLISLATAASAATVSYDTGYDNKSRSLTAVSCSDGTNGLMTRYGWKTQGDVPKFPYIGGVDAVAGWNDADCGKCYSLTYNGKTIYILAIDHAASGFNIGLDAMNDLTHGNGVKLGRITATSAVVAKSKCGL